MGLLDFFRRKGPESEERDEGAPTEMPEDRPGYAAEGPPAGVSDPGALTGEDVAGEDVVGADPDRGETP